MSLDKRFREAEAQAEMDFGPEYNAPKPSDWFWRKVPLIVVVIVIGMLWLPYLI